MNGPDYKNPAVPLIDNPVNLDVPIQDLQQQIAEACPWLTKVFGRAYESRKKNDTTKLIEVYPQVWQGVGEDLLNVLPNDNLAAQLFFKVEEPREVIQYHAGGHSMMKAKVSLIAWYNLERLDPAIDYSFGEKLLGSVQRVLTNAYFSNNSDIKILRVWETVKKVFEGYTLQDVRDQELIYPYGGFRIECELTYVENCPDNIYVVPQP